MSENKPTSIPCATSMAPTDGGFLLVRVGSDYRPATAEDIKDVQESISKLCNKDEFNCLVSHHAIDAQWVPMPEKKTTSSQAS